MSTDSVMPSNHVIFCHPPSPPFLILSWYQGLSNELLLHIRWSKYWSISFSISPSDESGLISFRIYWLELLAVQGTLKSLLQHHNLRASSFRHLVFVIQLSHPYLTTGKTIALTIWTFVGKVMLLLFYMMSPFIIPFFLRGKCLNFLDVITVCSDFGAQENKLVTVSVVSPSIFHEVMGLDTMIFVF